MIQIIQQTCLILTQKRVLVELINVTSHYGSLVKLYRGFLVLLFFIQSNIWSIIASLANIFANFNLIRIEECPAHLFNTYLGTSFPHAFETRDNPEAAALAALALLAGVPALQA